MLQVYSIFKSIQGEVNPWCQGRAAVFIRLVGCNLRCTYCDSMYAVLPKQDEVKKMSVEQILSYLESNFAPYKYVTITGGEPMLQQVDVVELTEALVMKGKKVVIETNGSFDIVDDIHNDSVSWVIDYKLEGSSERSAMINDWFSKLTNNDFVKFVITGDQDLREALEVVRDIRKENPEFENFAFSPVFYNDTATLTEWLVDELLKTEFPFVIVNLQIHKLIWRYDDGSEH